MKTYSIFCVFSLMLSSAMSAASLPNAAQIDMASSSYLQFSKIELDTNNVGSYKSLVKYNDKAAIDLTFNQLNTPRGDTYHIYIDEQLVQSGPIESDTTNVNFDYQATGYFDLRIEVCDLTECISSNDSITIIDTDGAHLLPLTMDIDNNNLDFENQTDKVIAGYFKESAIYDSEFTVDNIPANNITHLLYGYIPTCGENASLGEASNYDLTALQTACEDSNDYEIVILDPQAAFQKAFPQAGHDDKSLIKGNYAMLMALKQNYPSLKVLATIGGDTLSDQFDGLSDKNNRDVFINSVKAFLITWKFFDGINIDWHFPEQSTELATLDQVSANGETYTLLITELSSMLEDLTLQTGIEYQLTSEISAAAADIAQVDYAKAAEQLDYLFTKSFDFYGDENTIGHHSGLYCDEAITILEGCDTQIGTATPTADNAIQLLLKQGVAAEKIVMGVAMHGRGWSGIEESSFTQLDNPMSGTAEGKIFSIPSVGIWQPGVVNYKAIKEYILGDDGQGINGFVYGFDYYAQAPYLWNESTGELVSFDDTNSILSKTDYVASHDLAGVFSGELRADDGDILNAINQGLQSNDITEDEVVDSEIDSFDSIDLTDLFATSSEDNTSTIDYFKVSSVFNSLSTLTEIQLIEFENIVPTISLIPGSSDTSEINTVAAIPSHLVEALKDEETLSSLEAAELTQENDVLDIDDLLNEDEDENKTKRRTKKLRVVDKEAIRSSNSTFLFVDPLANSDSSFTNTVSPPKPKETSLKKDVQISKKKKIVKKMNKTLTGKGSSLFGFANFVSQFEASLNTFNELVPKANEEQEYEELSINVYKQRTSLDYSFKAIKNLSVLTDQLAENFNNNRRDIGIALIDNLQTLKSKAELFYKKIKPLNKLDETPLLDNEQ